MVIMILNATTGLQACSFICSHRVTYPFKDKVKMKFSKGSGKLDIILNMRKLETYQMRLKT